MFEFLDLGLAYSFSRVPKTNDGANLLGRLIFYRDNTDNMTLDNTVHLDNMTLDNTNIDNMTLDNTVRFC